MIPEEMARIVERFYRQGDSFIEACRHVQQVFGAQSAREGRPNLGGREKQ